MITVVRNIGVMSLVFTLGLGLMTGLHGQATSKRQAPVGTIKGRVIDAITRSPIVGASVVVAGTKLGAPSDTGGAFTFGSLPVGSYSLRASSVSHEPSSRADVIVKSERITHVLLELMPGLVEVEGTVVTGSYFSATPGQPTSSTAFTSEEIRRAPGSAGDISRIIMVLPSVAKVNDLVNSLIVRGGTPNENGFYVDDIEIPNVNHFPLPGSSGGGISLLNPDFIQDVSFSAGGFSTAYGDKLSAVVDVRFREGNRDEFDGQLDLSLAGIGAAAEGPLHSGRGSWLFSARKSFLELLVNTIGTGVAPAFSDYQGKAVYDLSPRHRLSFLALLGVDAVEYDRKSSDSSDYVGDSSFEGFEYAAGVSWRFLWSDRGYTRTSLSLLGTEFTAEVHWTDSPRRLADEYSREQTAQLRNVTVFQFTESDFLQVGIEGKYHFNDYDHYIDRYVNPLGDIVPSLSLQDEVNAARIGSFVIYTLCPLRNLSTSIGLRYDHFEYNRQQHLSPRASMTYHLGANTSLTAAAGVYYQTLPLSLLAQHERNRQLRDLLAYHYILSLNHQVDANTRFTMETYYKQYDRFPLDPGQPQLFIVDELVSRGFFGNYENLVDSGRAEAYGVELTLQRKLVGGLYGLVAGSFSRTRYRDLDGIWRNRIIDNQVLFSVEGGYKPNDKWEYSLRWIFAGGVPHTPLDIDASRLINRSVYDRKRVNEERFPAYHSLNLRADRRFHFSGSNLTVYLSVWNAYNRENIWSYYWNEIEEKEDVLYQWSMLPVIGLEFEF